MDMEEALKYYVKCNTAVNAAMIETIEKAGLEPFEIELTGNGYIAFELDKRYPRVRVRGLDIAEESIAKDAELAWELGLANFKFSSYDRGALPFDDGSFFGGVSRYALHHFSDIRGSLAEIQALRPDGYVHYYRRGEIEELFREVGVIPEREFMSEVRYPRMMDERYRRLLDERGERLVRFLDLALGLDAMQT